MHKHLEYFLNTKYPIQQKTYPCVHITEFIKLYPSSYAKIHRDALRSLHLSTTKGDPSRINLQAVFESFFINIIQLSQIDSSQYFQGLTDVFEVIFHAFILRDIRPNVIIQETDFQPFTDDLKPLFSNLDYALGVSVTILNDMYSESSFDVGYYLDLCRDTMELIRNNDNELYQLMVRANLNAEILLKYHFSGIVRYIDDPRISQRFLVFYLEYPTQRPLVVQRLLSVCFRLYTPQLMQPHPQYTLNLTPLSVLNGDFQDELLLASFTSALNQVLSNHDNLKSLRSMLEDLRPNSDKMTDKMIDLANSLNPFMF